MNTIEMVDYGQLPAVRIRGADGAQAIVTLYGAHLVSWQGADGAERLFCSAASKLDGSRAIRGGVPVIFPQFAERGTGLRHGFARVATWRLADSGAHDGAAFAVFMLEDGDLAPALAQAWPHGFALALRVEVHGAALALTLEVRNTGADAFAFSAALHTYFSVSQLGQVRIGGVQEGLLQIDDKFDHIYRGIDGAMTLADAATTLHLAQDGFGDAVVWNPGALDAAALNDMEDAEYQRFVCIEPALIEPLTLAAGAAWRGAHTIRIGA
ncbi:D-hexose-6-phosphate mutarotase [Massilia pseudoviolaceinigra]|uniref:D-hexose-6-phosphate mutarotase n=1 Tax=Massilia pseudoviolaceinigra TaxID=3057165 RepID=UPI002796D2EC|nr:D-hexose-6-phosphate mutarotase [Massilia sp. CCM 9206]MDQ1923202.1 D-hexose-6-phosphate mutarotase [Massilia sp. CCM 9206]